MYLCGYVDLVLSSPLSACHDGQVTLSQGTFPHPFLPPPQRVASLSSPLLLVCVLREKLFNDIIGNAHASPLSSMTVFEGKIPLLPVPSGPDSLFILSDCELACK